MRYPWVGGDPLVGGGVQCEVPIGRGRSSVWGTHW